MSKPSAIPSPLHVRFKLLRHEALPVLTFFACALFAVVLARGMISSTEAGIALTKSGKLRPAATPQSLAVDSASNSLFSDR